MTPLLCFHFDLYLSAFCLEPHFGVRHHSDRFVPVNNYEFLNKNDNARRGEPLICTHKTRAQAAKTSRILTRLIGTGSRQLPS